MLDISLLKKLVNSSVFFLCFFLYLFFLSSFCLSLIFQFSLLLSSLFSPSVPSIPFPRSFYFPSCFLLGFCGMAIFLANICAISCKIYFCASFAHKAEQLLRFLIVPHHTQQVLRKIICAKSKIAYNSIIILRKN